MLLIARRRRVRTRADGRFTAARSSATGSTTDGRSRSRSGVLRPPGCYLNHGTLRGYRRVTSTCSDRLPRSRHPWSIIVPVGRPDLRMRVRQPDCLGWVSTRHALPPSWRDGSRASPLPTRLGSFPDHLDALARRPSPCRRCARGWYRRLDRRQDRLGPFRLACHQQAAGRLRVGQQGAAPVRQTGGQDDAIAVAVPVRFDARR